MTTNKEYQARELRAFNESKSAFFDTVKEFNTSLKSAGGDWLTEQLEWVQNGSYGAGACLALQMAYASITPRCNAVARIGGVLLHALYGKRFACWGKLDRDVQDNLSAVVKAWLVHSEKSFAITWEG